MKDKIIESMRKKDCILGIVPDHGGMWLSPLRPDTPRNFAEKPEEWNDAVVVGYAEIGDHDCEFEISYKNNVDYPGQIFYSNSQNGSINLNLMSGNPNSFSSFRAFDERYPSLIIPIDAGVQNSGSHIVKFKRQNGTAEAWVDGELVKSVTSTLGNKPLYANTIPMSNFNGNIFYIRLTDLTTSETVWQASRDELYETNPWPSSVPENFAENAKAFYDYQAILSEQLDPTHDYSFFMDTEIVSDKSDCPMFYIGGADGVFGLYCYSNNTIRFTTNLLRSATNPNDKYANMIVYQGDARPAGRHSFEGRIEGNIIKTFFDNQPAFTSAVAVRTNTKTVGRNRCSSGYVYKIQITDLTDNRVIWSYPSEAERVHLLTKTNVRTDRGVFEAADTSARWNVKTPLRWQNLTAATIMARATVGDFPETVFSFALPANPNYSVILLRRSAESQLYASILGIHAGGYSIYRTITTDFTFAPGKKETFCLVFNIDGNFMRLYANGELLAERTLDQMVALAVDGGNVPGFMLGTTSSSDAINSGTTVSSALVFDRALTAAEIAALS